MVHSKNLNMKYLNFFSLLRLPVLFAAVFILSSCVTRQQDSEDMPTDGMQAADFAVIQQDLAYYARNLPNKTFMADDEQKLLAEQTKDKFLSPWTLEKASYTLKNAMWALFSMNPKVGFLAKDEPFPLELWEHLRKNSQESTYPSLAEYGIVIKNTSLRAMPTHSPFYLNPKKAGEGYPFDYFQQTALWLGTPVFISHVSKDGLWYFVESALAAGWLPAEEIAKADKTFRDFLQNTELVVVVQDKVPLPALYKEQMPSAQKKSETGHNIHIGTVLPLSSRTVEVAHVFIPVSGNGGLAKWWPISLGQDAVANYPLPLTAQMVASLGNKMMGQEYGWGGIDEKRDCSALMHDLFLPFGLWLPRNSSKQAETGNVIVLENLSEAEKTDYILSKGVPFFSMIFLPGHIGLYIGEYDGKPLLFHNVWGVRLEKQMPDGSLQKGRAVIGRAVVTTLKPGVELPYAAQPLGYMENIKKLTVLPPKVN